MHISSFESYMINSYLCADVDVMKILMTGTLMHDVHLVIMRQARYLLDCGVQFYNEANARILCTCHVMSIET